MVLFQFQSWSNVRAATSGFTSTAALCLVCQVTKLIKPSCACGSCWCSACFKTSRLDLSNYPDVFWAVGRFAWQLVRPKSTRENPMTRRSLMSSLDDWTSAWKYQIPVPCRVEKMPKFSCSHQTSPKTCTFVRKTTGMRRWVGKSDLQPWSNLRMLWVLEEQHQHDVMCYNWKGMIKNEVTMAVQRFSRFSMLHQGFNRLSDQGRGQLVLQKHQREACDTLKFMTSAWKYQIPVPCRVGKIPQQRSNLDQNLHVCSEDHGIASLRI